MLHVVVLITASSAQEADLISNTLVDSVKSIFQWQGKKENAEEVLLICKSTQNQFSKIVDRVNELHSYDVPEIIALPVLDGNKTYLKWIDESVA